MSGVGIVALLIAILGGCLLVTVLGLFWDLSNEPEDPVGPWRAKRQFDERVPSVPREFQSLIWSEAFGWRQEQHWEATMEQLDQLEIRMGGTPPPRIEEFDGVWLDQRIARVEALAGPSPAQMPPQPFRPLSTPFWKRWFS